MKIIDILSSHQPVISFEFFPPKTEAGLADLMETIKHLRDLSPAFVSVTYGAAGTTREKTIHIVSAIKREIGIEAAAHLTCVGQGRDELEGVLRELKVAGIENIIALRGDPPNGETAFKPVPNGFRYASELVKFIRDRYDFCLVVAGYPEKHIEAPSPEEDIRYLKEKVKAGGEAIITQLFFDNTDYFSFVKRIRAAGVSVPVTPGIMPVTDLEQIKRFTRMCGAKIPPTLLRRLEKEGNQKEAVVQIGIEHAVAQCEELLKQGAPGVHFYTLNRSTSTQEILRTLKRKGVLHPDVVS